MKSVNLTVTAQFFFDEDDVQARIEQMKLDDEAVSEEDVIYALALEAFHPVNAATIRDVSVDFASLK